MAGEALRESGSWVDLETNGGSIAHLSFGAADNAGFALTADGGDRPHLQFELELAYGTGPTANSPIALHHAPQNLFGGANHARDPAAGNLVGATGARVLVESTTSTQRFRFDLMFAPTDSKYWLQNLTGQTISGGWKLRARAWTQKPGT